MIDRNLRHYKEIEFNSSMDLQDITRNLCKQLTQEELIEFVLDIDFERNSTRFSKKLLKTLTEELKFKGIV